MRWPKPRRRLSYGDFLAEIQAMLQHWVRSEPDSDVTKEVASLGYDIGPFLCERTRLHIYTLLLAVRNHFRKDWQLITPDIERVISLTTAPEPTDEAALVQHEAGWRERLLEYMELWNEKAALYRDGAERRPWEDMPATAVAMHACRSAYGHDRGQNVVLVTLLATLFVEELGIFRDYFKSVSVALA